MTFSRLFLHAGVILSTLLFSTMSWSLSATSESKLLVIDPDVADYKQLVSGAADNTQFLLLNKKGNAFGQIADALSKKTYNSVHIVSHGEDGALMLAGERFDSQSIRDYSEELTTINKLLKDGSDLLIYGCDVAASEKGENFLKLLADKTGTDIAASRDKTGAEKLGGNWELEQKIGDVSSPVLFSQETQQNYSAVLTHFRGGSITWQSVELNNCSKKVSS